MHCISNTKEHHISGAYNYDLRPMSSYNNWVKRGYSKTNHRLSNRSIKSKKNTEHPHKYFVKFIINKLCEKHGLGSYFISNHIMEYYDITNLKPLISDTDLYIQKSKIIRNNWMNTHKIPISMKEIILYQLNEYNRSVINYPDIINYPSITDLKWHHYDCIIRKRWFIYELYKKNYVLVELLKDNMVPNRSKLTTKNHMVKALLNI